MVFVAYFFVCSQSYKSQVYLFIHAVSDLFSLQNLFILPTTWFGFLWTNINTYILVF